MARMTVLTPQQVSYSKMEFWLNAYGDDEMSFYQGVAQ